MTPYEEAKERANEIAKGGLEGMFVTISLGCEYCNSFDVEPDKPKETNMDFGSIAKLALTLLGKKDELMKLVKDGMAIFNRAKDLWPELGSIMSQVTGETPTKAAEDFDVKWLQNSLNKLVKAGLTVDGSYGKATMDAVKKFQQQNGLTPDGWAGVQTQAAIVDALK